MHFCMVGKTPREEMSVGVKRPGKKWLGNETSLIQRLWGLSSQRFEECIFSDFKIVFFYDITFLQQVLGFLWYYLILDKILIFCVTSEANVESLIWHIFDSYIKIFNVYIDYFCFPKFQILPFNILFFHCCGLISVCYES